MFSSLQSHSSQLTAYNRFSATFRSTKPIDSGTAEIIEKLVPEEHTGAKVDNQDGHLTIEVSTCDEGYLKKNTLKPLNCADSFQRVNK